MPKVLKKQKTRILKVRVAGHWTLLHFLKHVLGAGSRNRKSPEKPHVCCIFLAIISILDANVDAKISLSRTFSQSTSMHGLQAASR